MTDWQKIKEGSIQHITNMSISQEIDIHRWKPPEMGCVKLNVDASVFAGCEYFSFGIVLRACYEKFLEAKTLRLPKIDSIIEAETMGVCEALS